MVVNNTPPGIRWEWPFCAHVQTNSPQPQKSPTNTAHRHSPFSHPSICPSIFLPAAPWPTGSNGNPFYLLISVVGIYCAFVCVCIRFSPSVYDLPQGACDNQTHSKGKREWETITKNERGGGSTDIVIIAHLVHFLSLSLPVILPLSFQ